MASRIKIANDAITPRPAPMTARDLAVWVHVVMKHSGWERLDKGGTLAEDQQAAILVNAEDGRSFLIEVREV